KHLVIYDEGNLFSAPRAWWMLRTFGAEKVSILAGGLAGWQRDVRHIQRGERQHHDRGRHAGTATGDNRSVETHAVAEKNLI
ncbi:hypothetical protein KU735_24520, partial [Salmonella enterica subsp. enterica serovar Give]|nr:hypothetical protein [Salmonella enterica subsp. enterica serovar Give]